ncbi:MAG TPA: M48 family metallopeptidase [Planctomycetota bacterium]|nr:M48 family metallopeptidase [Planctomycetota bacterium]
MSNPFYYLAGLLMLSSYPQGFEPLAFAQPQRMLTPWALLGSLLVYAGICRAVLGRRPAQPALARRALEVTALLIYAELIFVFHLPLWIWELGTENDPLLSGLLGLAPLMALSAILAFVRARTGPRGGLGFGFRGFLGLSLLPILLILGLQEAMERVEPLQQLAFIYPVTGWVLVSGTMAVILFFLPVLLRGILQARPLPAGPLRERLERMCSVAGFRATDLLVIPTGRIRMANAFVVGFSARWRYVFFMDAILDGMTVEELECVLLHEITHSQKRHIPFYLVFALAFSLSTALVYELLNAAQFSVTIQSVGILAWALCYWRFGFGWISRRFETEADLVAARLAPPASNGLAPYVAARSMATALDRVAALNHVPLWAPSWRHFSIERRIDILLHAEIDPSIGARFERTCDRLRRGALALVGLAILLGGVLLWVQHGRAPENRALWAAHEAADRGHKLLEEKRYEAARTELKRGIEGGSDSAIVWIWLADCERALGRDEEAEQAESVARQKDHSDPRLRLRLDRR